MMVYIKVERFVRFTTQKMTTGFEVNDELYNRNTFPVEKGG